MDSASGLLTVMRMRNAEVANPLFAVVPTRVAAVAHTLPAPTLAFLRLCDGVRDLEALRRASPWEPPVTDELLRRLIANGLVEGRVGKEVVRGRGQTPVPVADWLAGRCTPPSVPAARDPAITPPRVLAMPRPATRPAPVVATPELATPQFSDDEEAFFARPLEGTEPVPTFDDLV